MQKKLIALAVAGLSTAAFAQSTTNVTIYGVADVSGQGFSLTKSKAPDKADGGAQGNVFALSNNSSLLGFRGTEDLGGGLKAIFQAESWLNLTGQSNAGSTNTTGSNAGTAVQYGGNAAAFGTLRDTYVGLQGRFGTVKGGFNSTPLRVSLNSFDVMPGATGSGQIETMMGSMRIVSSRITSTLPGLNGASLNFQSSIRATSVAYAMPTLYGFDASVAYTGSNNNGLSNQTGLTTTYGNNAIPQSVWGLNLGWTGYGVNIQGAYQRATNDIAAQTNTSSSTALPAASGFGSYTSYLLGASYTGIAGLKIAGVYMHNSLAGINNTFSYLDNNQFWAGASYRIGNWEPRVSAAWIGGVKGDDAHYNQLGARQWTANLGYYLSKRTQVYGLLSNLNNSANQNYAFNSSPSNLKPTGGQNAFTYGMGIRHTF